MYESTLCVQQMDMKQGTGEKTRIEKKSEHTTRYSKLLASVLIPKVHQLGVAYFLLFSGPKFLATIPTP